MSASLVGSEMCIRDSCRLGLLRAPGIRNSPRFTVIEVLAGPVHFTNQFIDPPINRSINQSVSQSVNQSADRQSIDRSIGRSDKHSSEHSAARSNNEYTHD
eukprot:6457859-Alexandrium_andersonii.AAC.1